VTYLGWRRRCVTAQAIQVNSEERVHLIVSRVQMQHTEPAMSLPSAVPTNNKRGGRRNPQTDRKLPRLSTNTLSLTPLSIQQTIDNYPYDAVNGVSATERCGSAIPCREWTIPLRHGGTVSRLFRRVMLSQCCIRESKIHIADDAERNS